jgi:tetratricopeptide (TPR) repeat protein
MTLKQITFTALLLIFLVSAITAQKTSIYQEAQVHFKTGSDLYDKSVYGLAMESFSKASRTINTPADHQTEVLKTQSDLMYALSALHLEQEEAEKLVLDFVRDNKGNPLASKALFELGNYAYAAKKYDEAAEYFGMMDRSGISEEQYAEAKFKQGYAMFVKKKFSQAKTAFGSLRNVKNEYYYPSNYYYGMSSFYLNNYKDAIDGYKIASGTRKYRVQVPYYIVQIHFSQKEFDEVITYGEQALKETEVQKKVEIGQMIGMAYFEKGEYAKALPYLNEYASKSNSMKDGELYTVGYVNYHAKSYEKAIEYFRRSSSADDQIGQQSNYYLGMSYTKTGERALARTAFSKAANMKFVPEISEDALFQYAKLSVELNADKEAIETLLKVPTTSKNYSEAQDLIADVLQKTKDYENAIKVIESLKEMSPRIKEAYQKVTFNRGLQLYNDKQHDQALVSFDKSLKHPVDAKIKTMATFWKAEIYHQRKDYKLSITEFNSFLNQEKSVSGIPDPSLIHLANYAQGYNYLKQDDFSTSLTYFEKTIDGIKKNSSKINSDLVRKNVFGDAVLRAGDAYFKRNRYAEASKYYNEAITNKYSGYDYAIFQKAIISGLENKLNQKIDLLESLVSQQPNSSYADDALFELGYAYEDAQNPGKAKEALNKLVTQYKDKSNLVNQGYIKLGLISYNAGDKNAAIKYYKSIFNNNPTKQEADDALAALEEIYVVDMGQSDEYFKFLETIPGYKVAGDTKDSLTFRVAQVQYENGNYDRAITGYGDYISKYPKGAYLLQAYYNRAESYLVQKKYADGLKDYETVVEKGQSPYYLKAVEKAAIISYNFTEDFQKSYSYYTKLESSTNNLDLKFDAQLGALRSASRINNSSGVLSYAEKVMENPKATSEHRATAHFLTGKIHFDKKEYDKALPQFRSTIELTDNVQTAEARYNIAFILFQKKDYENAEAAAREVLEKSASYSSWVAKSLILMSDVYVAQGDLVSAKAALEAVIENFDQDPEIVAEAKEKLRIVEQKSNSSKKPTTKKNSDEIDFDNTGGK